MHFGYVGVIPAAARETYERALAAVGKLDHEIALLRTNLSRYLETCLFRSREPDPDRVRKFADDIGKLEERRARILQAATKPDDHSDVDRWLRAVMGESSAE